jgi:2,4-dienoyl-CoA reductase-like NADH-dependent reductase (Old Yellow Enzyme family)
MTEPASPQLFTPYKLAGITLPNRIAVSPMCQYSAQDGMANDWHLVHLGSRAVGGAGLILVEASAVSAEGRITPGDMGLWKEAQIEPLARIVRFLHSQGTYAGIQLAHAGRKASMSATWLPEHLAQPDEGGWTDIVAPSATAFDRHYGQPHALTIDGIDRLVEAFADAAVRALSAGFDLAEIHSAHGYLLHEFLSPLANHRTDEYGGSFENRTRLLLRVVDAVREVWPLDLPLLVRISATDWMEEAVEPGDAHSSTSLDDATTWTPDQSVALAKVLKTRGVDMIDVSSGGLVPNAKIPLAPGYQVPFAARIRREAAIPTAAVGLITTAEQAEAILRDGDADLVFLAREMLREPYWPLHASAELGGQQSWPVPYHRAAPKGASLREPIAAPEAQIAQRTERDVVTAGERS